MSEVLKGSPIVIEDLKLTDEWDKTFPQSGKVDHRKIKFVNRYGITLAADLYKPKGVKEGEKLPALAMAGPFGGVKEQVSGRYAQKLAENGFITIAFDPSFTGESGGYPRAVASPDINTEDFLAAVDYMSTSDEIDPEKIGIIGICGFGGLGLNAAAADPRIKAAVTSTMYDMSRLYCNGYFDEGDSIESRAERKAAIAAQRTKDYKNGFYETAIVNDPHPAPDAPQFKKEYSAFYRTPLGYSPRSVGSNNGWNKTNPISFMNMPIETYIEEIQAPVLLIHGEKAHSRYFSEASYEAMKGGAFADNKKLMIIPGANHTDLYYKMDVIPFDTITEFFKENLH